MKDKLREHEFTEVISEGVDEGFQNIRANIKNEDDDESTSGNDRGNQGSQSRDDYN